MLNAGKPSSEKKASIMAKEMNSKNSDRLEVTVIPVDEDPYSKIVQIPHSMIGKSPLTISASSAQPACSLTLP